MVRLKRTDPLSTLRAPSNRSHDWKTRFSFAKLSRFLPEYRAFQRWRLLQIRSTMNFGPWA